MKDVLKKNNSHIGNVKDNLRDLAALILRKVDCAAEHSEGICVFVDTDGDVWAARSLAARTMSALVKYPNALVGTYSAVMYKRGGDEFKQSRRTHLPSVDELAEDIGQHENSFGVVNEFLAEAA